MAFEDKEGRLRVCYILVGVVFLYLFVGLIFRQVVQYDKFLLKERQQSMRRIIKPAIRGNVYDRNGKLLCGSQPVFSLNIYLNELRGEFRKEYLRRLKKYRNFNRHFNAYALQSESRHAIVQRYLNNINNLLDSNYTVSSKDVNRHFTQKPILPMVLVRDLSTTEYAKLIESLPVNSPLQISVDSARYYPYGRLACHALGYVSGTDDLESDGFDGDDLSTFKIRGQVGKSGIEKFSNDILCGENGGEIWIVDTSGFQHELVTRKVPVPGNSVTLSIDIDLQCAVEEALGDVTGCAIVIDVRSGEVLAIASMPNYDLNELTPFLSKDVYDRINTEEAWFNQAIQGLFPVGSAFKMFTSIELLKYKVLAHDEITNCEGKVRVGDRIFRCDNRFGHGKLDFKMAIASSCNIPFFLGAQKIDADILTNDAKKFGFSEPTGIELPNEATHMLVPTPEWKKRKGYGPWVLGDSVNFSIGQGYLLMTPLQICCFTSSVAANRLRTNPTMFHNKNNKQTCTETIGLEEADYKFLIDSLVAVVDKKTGRRSKISGLDVAGKTGTAQFWENGKKRNVAWFTCFAPAYNPEIAITVINRERKDGDSFYGGSHCAPIAKKILEYYFKK